MRPIRRLAVLFAAGCATFFLAGVGVSQEAPGGNERLPPGATLLDVPYLPQSELLCGGAAAAMVLRYWGMSGVRAEDFADLVSETRGGIRATDLAARLRELGWDAFPFDGRFEEIRRHLRLGRPIISLLEVGEGRYHYVVLIGEAGDRLVLHDPAESPFQLVDRRELEAAWAATDGLSLLAVPSGNRAETVREPGPDDEAAPAELRDPELRDPELVRLTPECRARLDRAVRLAMGGRLDEADRLLSTGDCRGESPFLRELAGVRLRRGRANEAVDLARRALDLDGGDRHAARTLATALYVLGDAEGALVAWNRAGQPTVDLIRILGLERISYRSVARQLGVRGGDRLTPRSLAMAARRLAELPAVAASRVDYLPTGSGRVDLVAGIAERAGLPTSPVPLVATGLRAAINREVALTAVSPLGRGEAWTAAWRWWERRPAVRFRLSTPAEFGRPAIVGVAGGWARETFALDPDAPTARSEEERTGAELGWSSWLSPALRAELRAGYDRWLGVARDAATDPAGATTSSESHLRLGGSGEVRGAGERIRFSAGADRWIPLDGGGAFTSVDARLEATSRTRPDGTVLSGRLYLESVARRTPRSLWPGAGTGIARPNLLRAHPLLEDGVIEGRTFDRHLAGGGAEVTRWFAPATGLRLGGALFLDAARAWGERPGVSLVDGGVGLRLTTAGGGPTLRLDLATGLSDDEWALSVGWSSGPTASPRMDF